MENRQLIPDFSKSTVDILAKRAGQMCSNIECRTLTSGPSESPDKAVNIGEAAHIFGARNGTARYRDDMTDVSRAEITNSIWLCRNCHKLIDSDPKRFTANLLFQWRIVHEQYVISKLGTPNDKLKSKLEKPDDFVNDSPLVRRIVYDRPDGWEYRLTSELLRDYLKASTRGWRDLQRALYTRPPAILSDDDAIAWFQAKIEDAERLVGIVATLYTQELPPTWGPPGEPGEPLEIRHVCKLIQSAAEQLLGWEASVRSVSVPSRYSKLFACLPGTAGLQLDQLAGVPPSLDEVADWIETSPGVPKSFHFKLIFTLPDGWSKRVSKELDKINRKSFWSW